MNTQIYHVPLKPLTAETAKGLGAVFQVFDQAPVELRQWPARGTRPVNPVTGYGKVVEGPFEVFWKGEVLFSRNNAIGREDVLGWAVEPAVAREDVSVPAVRPFMYVSFVNYHDDGGQAFFPHHKKPTVFLVAPPGDDVRPEDFVALYSDGGLGLSLHPGIWHTAPLPLSESEEYDNKQGSIHACVECDFLKEQGLLLSVPLRVP